MEQKRYIMNQNGEDFLICSYGGNIKSINRLSKDRLEVVFSPITRIPTTEMDTPIIFNKVNSDDSKPDIYVREKCKKELIDAVNQREYIACGAAIELLKNII